MLTERFDDALIYAHTLHREQVRKGNGAPYVAHLLAVAGLALEFGANENEAIAALLHDAVEDQGGEPTLHLIRERFGDAVADIVAECSEDEELEARFGWRKRKEHAVAKIFRLSAAAQLVTVADKLHNARALLSEYRGQGEEIWERFNGGRAGSLWYYRAMTDALREAGAPSGPVHELGVVVDELERLAAAALQE